MEMTREEAIRNFREHWASLAITGTGDKKDYLKRHSFPPISHNCFLCEYKVFRCECCPIEWPDTLKRTKNCPCETSYYWDWLKSSGPEERERLAAIIRDLPEKKEKTEPKFKPGDKVVPISKTVPGFEDDISEEPNWKRSRERGYFFVTGVNECETRKNGGKTVYYCDDCETGFLGNFYFETDLIPYVEPKEKTLADFKIGDRVVVVSNDEPDYKGKTGTVKSLFSPVYGCVGVELDERIGRHDLSSSGDGGKCEFGHGKWVEPSDLAHYTEPPKEVKPEPVCKFKVGDIVKGNDSKRYGVTNDKMTKGEVVKIISPDVIEVIILEHNNTNHIDSTAYIVDPKYFDLVEPRTRPINFCPKDKTVEDTCQADNLPRKFIFNGNTTICIISLFDKEHKGIAKCAPDDIWNEKKGKDLAYARARIAFWQEREQSLLQRKKRAE